MTIKKILVTGEELFLNRHRLLFDSLSTYVEELECMAIGHLYEPQLFRRIMRLAYCISTGASLDNSDGFFKNAKAFATRSQRIERSIKKLKSKPDLVLHVFALCCPFWQDFSIPYAIYLDYTMALAARNHPPFAPFRSTQDLDDWIACERKAYQQAKYILTMSAVVKSSLIEDYQIDPQKITVVGSSGNCQQVEGEKSFGTHRLLFNGSDFDRKGGQLVLETFDRLKQLVPDVKLAIVGKKLDLQTAGIENPGIVKSTADMRELFLTSDLVFAPATCDPFPTFVLEAMNYGVPCIVSDRDGMPEIVEDGKTGLVITERNPATVATQIAKLLSDRQTLSSMSQHAKNRITTKFNWPTIANNIATVLLRE
jgi:glycogen synthase